MDSNNFAPSGQGQPNNMTSQTSPPNLAEPIEPAPSQPDQAVPEPDFSSPTASPHTDASESLDSLDSISEPPYPMESAHESIPGQRPVEPTFDSGPTLTPEQSVINPSTSTPEPVSSVPEPAPSSIQQPAPVSEPTEANTVKKPSVRKKLYIIIGSCLIAISLIIVVLFFIPFGDKTLWNMMAGGNSISSRYQTGSSVTSGGYSYVANLDLDYIPNGQFSDGMLRAEDNNGNTVFLNNAGELAFTIESPYSTTNHFSDELLLVNCKSSNDKDDMSNYFNYSYDNDKYGYFDKTGELVIPCQFADAESFNQGYAVVSRYIENTKTPVSETTEELDIAIDGEEYINEYDDTYYERYGDYIKQYAIIDKTGKIVVDYQNNSISEVGNNVYYAYDSSAYESYCYDFQGNVVGSPTYSNKYGYTCITQNDDSDDSDKDAVQARLGENYRVNQFNEGLALVTSMSPLEAFFVDQSGNKVWSIDVNKAIDIDSDGYEEGLFLAFMWVGDEPYEGAEEMMKYYTNESSESSKEAYLDFQERLYRNAGAVYYDHDGNPVFVYRYSKGHGDML